MRVKPVTPTVSNLDSTNRMGETRTLAETTIGTITGEVTMGSEKSHHVL